MGAWDIYQDRINVRGVTKRDTIKRREIRHLQNKIPDGLSYQTVTIFDGDNGVNVTSQESISGSISKNVAIINSDNLNEKYIYSLPGDDIGNGALVEWMDNYWLVFERDANTTLYTRAKMIQCNYLLKWVSDDNRICEQWCVIEDGTKYLTGEYEDRNFVVTRGDSRIAMTIARNSMTSRFGRDDRFLIDDIDSKIKIAYALTKPLKIGNVYNGAGAFKFVLQEVQTTDNDNQEECIADYYKHFPKSNISINSNDGTVINTDNISDDTGKKVWL